jgi:hypothetical protein
MKNVVAGVVLSMGLAAPATVAAAREDAPPRRSGYFFRGYGEAGLMTPHNEMDMNLRRPDRPETNGFGDNYARYSLRGQLFIGKSFGTGAIRDVFVIVKPHFVFGRTIPQIEYTWSMRPIGYLRNWGAGVSLGGNWTIYLERHRWTFRDKIAITGDGPYGFHNMLSVRKTFDLKF